MATLSTRADRRRTKAPMDEIARGGATTVPRALRGFDGDADGEGWNVARRGRWCFKRVMPSPVWNQQGIAHNPSVLGQILSE
jgi:hypothetical protein